MNKISKNDVMFVSVSRYFNENKTCVEFQRVYSSKAYTFDSIHSFVRLENVINRLGKPITSIRKNLLNVTFPVMR